MKKYEYLSELEKRLSALPADARRDALNYYEQKFLLYMCLPKYITSH